MIFTIGHSTRSAGEFLELLRVHRIEQVADVRTIPKSKRHPHFSRDTLDEFLDSKEIAYRHFPALGGLRKPRPDSINTAWQHPGFRGYADYMQTDAFNAAVNELLTFASGRTAVMCAEAVWWQCHRRLLSDALIVRGVPVRHIISLAEPKPHELSGFARADGSKVTYPGLL